MSWITGSCISGAACAARACVAPARNWKILSKPVASRRADQSHRRCRAASRSSATSTPAAAALQVVGHVQDHQRRQAQAEDRRGQHQMPARLVESRISRTASGLRQILHLAEQNVVRDALVFGAGIQAVDAGQIDHENFAAGSSFTLPMRCSTVTPGKFATFWRRPVSRLNRVDLPELGGPTIATMCRRVGIAGGGGRVRDGATVAIAHNLYNIPLRRIPWPQDQFAGGLAPQRDLRPIHAENPRIAARSGMARRDRMTGQKSQLHQPPRVILRQVQAIQNARFPMLQFHEIGGFRVRLCFACRAFLTAVCILNQVSIWNAVKSNSWSIRISIASCN